MQLFPREAFVQTSPFPASQVAEKLHSMLNVPLPDPARLIPIGPNPSLKGKVIAGGVVELYYHRPWKRPYFRPIFTGTLKDIEGGSEIRGEFHSRRFDKIMQGLFLATLLGLVIALLYREENPNTAFMLIFSVIMLALGVFSPRIGWFNGRYDRALILHALEIATKTPEPVSEAS